MKALLISFLLSTFAFCDLSIYISHNNKLSKISHKDLADIYLKKTDTVNGIKVIPVDSKNQELFQEFYKKIIKKSPKQLHAYWMKQIYRGNTQPPKRLSPSAIKKAMQKNKSIIAYDKDPKNGRILLTIK